MCIPVLLTAFPEKMVERYAHNRFTHALTLMHRASVVGLKALHDLLNKRLEQQVKKRTVRSMANVVLCVHTDV